MGGPSLLAPCGGGDAGDESLIRALVRQHVGTVSRVPALLRPALARTPQTQPWHWYFSNALPRALLAAYPLAAVAPIIEPRARVLALPLALFLGAYSWLPHKELRFIIYALPIANVLAATVLDRL